MKHSNVKSRREKKELPSCTNTPWTNVQIVTRNNSSDVSVGFYSTNRSPFSCLFDFSTNLHFLWGQVRCAAEPDTDSNTLGFIWRKSDMSWFKDDLVWFSTPVDEEAEPQLFPAGVGE